jgi:hypothetical protein
VPLGERDALSHLVPLRSLVPGHAGGVAYGGESAVRGPYVLLGVEWAFLKLLSIFKEL